MIDAWDAVAALTTEHTELIDGRPVTADPLLLQLAQARYASIGAGGTRGGGEGSMLNYAAYELWEEIDGRVRATLDDYGQPHKGELAPLLPRLVETIKAEHAGKRIDDAYADELYGYLSKWVRKIRDLIDPPHVKEITAPCPACGERYETTSTTVGRPGSERVIVTAQAAVRIPIRLGHEITAECHCCGSLWRGRDELVQLAEGIGEAVDFTALIELASPLADTAHI